MKLTISIVFIWFFYFNIFGQTSKPKIESMFNLSQQTELDSLTRDLIPFRVRIEGDKFTYPCFLDKEDNVFFARVTKGVIHLSPGEKFDYVQN